MSPVSGLFRFLDGRAQLIDASLTRVTQRTSAVPFLTPACGPNGADHRCATDHGACDIGNRQPNAARHRTPRRDVVLEALMRSLEEPAGYRLNCRVNAATALGPIEEARVALAQSPVLHRRDQRTLSTASQGRNHIHQLFDRCGRSWSSSARTAAWLVAGSLLAVSSVSAGSFANSRRCARSVVCSSAVSSAR